MILAIKVKKKLLINLFKNNIRYISDISGKTKFKKKHYNCGSS